jgi:hypothetical protein
MKNIQFTNNLEMKGAHIVLALALIIAVLPACTKVGLPGLSNPSMPTATNAALLSEEVDVSTNSQNVVFDSVTTQFQYDNNKNVTQVQRTDGYLISGSSGSSSQTWNFTYADNLIASSTETFSSQTTYQGTVASNSSGQTNTTFYSNGGHISYYVGVTNLSATSFGVTVNETSIDSAVFAYNGNHISRYTLYQLPQGASTYSLIYDNSYTYSGDNLSGFVDQVTTAGGSNTVTGTYSYDNKTSYLPINYVVPGVYFYTANNVSKLTTTTTGSSSSEISSSYQWTYNSSNQPSACKATIITNPTSYDNGAVVSSNYYYQ